jgi:uncharacterized protein
MTRPGKMAGTAAAMAALLLVATSSEAQVNRKQPTQSTKLTAVAKTMPTQDTTKPHRLILQVNSNEPAMMNLALNNATNVAQYYQALGEKVNIDIVTFGPGLYMLRDDTSPAFLRKRGHTAHRTQAIYRSNSAIDYVCSKSVAVKG